MTEREANECANIEFLFIPKCPYCGGDCKPDTTNDFDYNSDNNVWYCPDYENCPIGVDPQHMLSDRGLCGFNPFKVKKEIAENLLNHNFRIYNEIQRDLKAIKNGDMFTLDLKNPEFKKDGKFFIRKKLIDYEKKLNNINERVKTLLNK